MRIAILGAGSLGSLYGALLSQVEGVELFVHGRGIHGAHMAAHGLSVEGERGFFVSNEEVFFSLDEVGLPPSALASMDFILLTGKSDQSEMLAGLAQQLLSADGYVLSLSNGLGHAEFCQGVLGPHRVFAATSTHGAWRPKAGTVHWAGKGETVLGSLSGGPGLEEAQPFLSALDKAGLSPQWSNDGIAIVWIKVLLNIAINPIAAIAGVNNGVLLRPDLFSSALSTMLEGASVARLERVILPDDSELEEQLRRVINATSENMCSMLQDLRNGRQTEIKFLNQAIVERGERVGIQTPLNQMLAAVITALHVE